MCHTLTHSLGWLKVDVLRAASEAELQFLAAKAKVREPNPSPGVPNPDPNGPR